MMRVLFLFCLSFCFLKADAQLPWNYPGAGIRMKKMIADSVAQIPSDTTNNKTGIARIGSTVYVGNGVKWTASGGSSDTNFVRPQRLADSAAAIRSALIDTAANIRGDFPTYTGVTQQQLDDTSAAIRGAIPSQPNQLLFGGEITEVSPLQFFITSAQYRIGGRTFTSPDTTITLAAAGDSNRIDVFVVDTLNRVVSIQGTQSSNPVPPSVDPIKELLLNFVFVGTDTVYQPVITPQYWTQSGADIININAGNVLTGNQFRATGGFNVTPALSGNATFNGIRYAAENTVDMFVGNNNVARWFLVGNGTGAFYDLFGTFNPASGTGTGSAIKLRTTVAALGANAKNYYQLEIVPTYTQGVLGTGTLAGVYYNPTINSLNTSTHYAWWSTSGGIRAQGLSYSADTTYLGLCIDANGNFYRCPRSTGSGGGGGITRQELIDTANAIRSSLASFQAAMYDSLTAIRGAIPAAGVSQSALNDTAAAIRNYTTENIRYVAPDSGIVMTVVGDTAKFSVDTAYLKNVVHPYKSYVAKLSQSGTNPPVANIIYNDLGNITWSRLDVGSYLAELSGSFQPEKTFIINQVSYGVPINGQLGLVYTTYVDADSIGVKSVDAFVSGDSPFSDDIIYDTYIEIRVYN